MNYLYHYGDFPVAVRELDTSGAEPGITTRPTYKRMHLIGSSFANTFDDLTFRGEVGYSIGKYYSTSDTADTDGLVKADELAYVLDFDYYGVSDTLLSAQVFQNIVVGGAPGLARDKVDTSVTFLARRDYLRETLVVESMWVHNLNNGDGLWRPKVKYELADNRSVWAGIDVFYGASRGMFNQFDGNDRMNLGYQVSF